MPPVNISATLRPSIHLLSMQRMGFFAYAKEFFTIAKKTRLSPVKCYLLGHALELYLKAYLLKQGVPLKKLKRSPFGHNIAKLLAEAQKRGFDNHFKITPMLKDDLDSFSSHYLGKQYEYFPLLAWTFGKMSPPASRLWRFAGLLHKHLGKIIC